MKKLFIRISIFSILTICVLIIIDPYFLRNQYGDQASFNSFYNAGSNEVDILLIGNSHLHRGVDPYIIEAKIKANTEIIVGGGSTISQVYFNLLEALEYQTPKIVVIETWPLVVPNYQNNDFAIGLRYPHHHNLETHINFKSESYIISSIIIIGQKGNQDLNTVWENGSSEENNNIDFYDFTENLPIEIFFKYDFVNLNKFIPNIILSHNFFESGNTNFILEWDFIFNKNKYIN